MDFALLKKERPQAPAHPDFGLMSRSLASRFSHRSSAVKDSVPLWNPSPP
jgi:hypothetical protein